jgi:hypothetical protein
MLGLDRDDPSELEIKRAMRRMLKMTHPDRAAEADKRYADERTKAVYDAAQLLIERARRSAYGHVPPGGTTHERHTPEPGGPQEDSPGVHTAASFSGGAARASTAGAPRWVRAAASFALRVRRHIAIRGLRPVSRMFGVWTAIAAISTAVGFARPDEAIQFLLAGLYIAVLAIAAASLATTALDAVMHAVVYAGYWLADAARARLRRWIN